MLPECCNLKPVVLGEEPDFCSGRPSRGRLQVGKPVTSPVSRGKGFLHEGGLFPPRLSAESADPSKGMGFKIASATASAAKPSDHPGVGHVSPPGRLRRCQTWSHAAPRATGTTKRPLPTRPLLRMLPTYPHRPANPTSLVGSSSILSDPRAHPGGLWEERNHQLALSGSLGRNFPGVFITCAYPLSSKHTRRPGSQSAHLQIIIYTLP